MFENQYEAQLSFDFLPLEKSSQMLIFDWDVQGIEFLICVMFKLKYLGMHSVLFLKWKGNTRSQSVQFSGL